MRSSYLITAVLLLTISVLPAQAVDLTKIDRTIAKEPVYKGKPKYCLLVFGTEAKFRAWLVLDGDVLFVDRNGNGDLTEAGKQVKGNKRNVPKGANYTITDFQAGNVTEPDGKATGLSISSFKVFGSFDSTPEVTIKANGPLEQSAGRLHFADRPQDAPISHFGGPLTIMVLSGRSILYRGGSYTFEPTIGTPGLGQGTFAGIGIKARDLKAKDPRAMPMAEVELPASAAGAEPIKLTIKLEPDS